MTLWLKNTDNKHDAVLTLAVLGFMVILVKLALAGASITVAGRTITFGTLDGSVVAALLTPTLGSYVARRYTDRKFCASRPPEEKK